MIRAAALAFILLSGSAWAEDVVSDETAAAMDQIGSGDADGGVAALEALIEAGDSSAIEGLGELLNWGAPGVTRNPQRACDLFERGAAAGRGDSAHGIAGCFYNATGRDRDYARAAEFYRLGVERGFQMSRCALGNMYVRGEGVTRDGERGMTMCLESANAGDVDAMTDVGEHLMRGEVGEPDYEAARHWFERAAAGGQRNAPFWLGALYWNGDGVAEDRSQAAVWWRMAFERGRLDAARYLGDEALSRLVDAVENRSPDWRAPADEAMAWYRIAMEHDPREETRALAAIKIAQVSGLVEGR